MGFSIALLWIAALGCGSSNNLPTSSDQGGVAASMDMSVPELGSLGGGGSDMSAPMCDVATQTGCAAGEKCVPKLAGMGNRLQTTCVPNGSMTEGQACAPPAANATVLTDNCVGGTFCDNDGAVSAYVCRKICSSDSACTTMGQKCGLLLTRRWGLCLPTCTLYGNDCPSGNDCAVAFDDIASTNMTAIGFFVCKKTGAGQVFGACQMDSDCGPALTCDQGNGYCVQDCDNAHACTQPPPDDAGTTPLACQPYSNLANGAGVCG